MKSIRIYASLFVSFAWSITVQAQPCAETEAAATQPQVEETIATKPEPAKARKGTYQFFVVGEDSTQLLRTDLTEKIESYRDDHIIVHLKVSSTTTIRILPKSEINDPRFMPLAQEVIFQPDYASQTAKK